ncbi:MAG: tripartite tricarboxylate transporter TctB family protein [Thermodesulfobacteriota bacterium]|nr:tripartite tricarboxylate transporter TctB family protein [Thermodesulfobacteriota bacterium]
MKRDELIGGIVIFIFGAITVLLSLRMPIGTFRMAGAGLFPLCLGILLMVLSSIFLLRFLFKKWQNVKKEESPSEIPGSAMQVLFFMGAMILATLFFKILGYPLVSFLLMVALLRILGMKQWPFNISLSLITAIASYFLFVQWLKIPLPKGWIGL